MAPAAQDRCGAPSLTAHRSLRPPHARSSRGRAPGIPALQPGGLRQSIRLWPGTLALTLPGRSIQAHAPFALPLQPAVTALVRPILAAAPSDLLARAAPLPDRSMPARRRCSSDPPPRRPPPSRTAWPRARRPASPTRQEPSVIPARPDGLQQPLDDVMLLDHLQPVDDAAGQVVADPRRQRVMVGARNLQVMMVRVGGVGRIHAHHQHRPRIV